MPASVLVQVRFQSGDVVSFLNPSLQPSRVNVQNLDIRGVKLMTFRLKVGPKRGRFSLMLSETLLEWSFSLSYIMGGTCLRLEAINHT